MKRHSILGLGLMAAGALLVAVLPGAAGGKGGEVTLSDAQFTRLVSEEGKFLTEALAKDASDKKVSRKIQAAAVMAAAYGQFSKHPEASAAKGHALNVYNAFMNG